MQRHKCFSFTFLICDSPRMVFHFSHSQYPLNEIGRESRSLFLYLLPSSLSSSRNTAGPVLHVAERYSQRSVWKKKKGKRNKKRLGMTSTCIVMNRRPPSSLCYRLSVWESNGLATAIALMWESFWKWRIRLGVAGPKSVVNSRNPAMHPCCLFAVSTGCINQSWHVILLHQGFG